ncbi:PAS domain-containing sensor histidine kinase [Caulobacter sp. 17J65-9]|uniref:ATP-binding protein n=1 Tax=Caulobacter sp. 17J65-9 TaxID=2709382 RepID=UPI0013CCF270|nr:PAS domain-containing protein [Caulobacter sp. 17J65-9]
MTDHPSELDRLLAVPEARALMDALMSYTPSITTVVRATDLKVLRVSDFASELLGLMPVPREGVPFDVYAGGFSAFDAERRPMRFEDRPLIRAVRGEVVHNQFGYVQDSAERWVPIVCNAAPIRDAEGRVIGAILSCTDITKQKQLEDELRDAAAQKEALFRELAHRVKNHLQIMSGLIALDARDDSLSAAEVAERNQYRLRMLAAVYDSLTQAEAGERIGARVFVDDVCRPYRTEQVAVDVDVEPADLTLAPDQAAPFGMLLNEAVCNAYKHAFPDRAGRVQVSLRRAGEGLVLEVVDDGVGLPAEAADRPSHGLKLMRLQADQLHGSLTIGDRQGGGAVVTAALPEAPA